MSEYGSAISFSKSSWSPVRSLSCGDVSLVDPACLS